MATSLVCLPQYAYSAVQFRKCVVYMGHTTLISQVLLYWVKKRLCPCCCWFLPFLCIYLGCSFRVARMPPKL